MINFTWTDNPEQFDSDEEVSKLKFYKEKSKYEIVQQFLSGSAFEALIRSKNHLFVEADNYPFLKIVSGHLENQVNLIYIDPPYNTGNTFAYDDDFATSEDQHGKWLSFMYRRLGLARNILREDGCIFIAIDQRELYVLKLLCDKIFGEENFVNDFMWLHGKGKKDKWSRTLQQHTLCYAKNKRLLKPFCDVEVTDWAKSNPDDDPRGNWFSGSISFTEERSNPKHRNFYSVKSPSGKVWRRQWMVSKEEMELLLATDKIYFGRAPDFDQVPRIKIFNSEETEIIPKNIIDSVDSTRAAQNHLDELLGKRRLFDNPKPVDLIEHLIRIAQLPSDALIMDFFAGSGTTFEAVNNLNIEDGGNRRCILVQKGEVNIKHPEITISEICRERIKKVWNEGFAAGAESGTAAAAGGSSDLSGASGVSDGFSDDAESSSDVTGEDYISDDEAMNEAAGAGEEFAENGEEASAAGAGVAGSVDSAAGEDRPGLVFLELK